MARLHRKIVPALELSEFPTDRHTFTIHFVSVGYREDDLKFVPDNLRGVIGGSIAEELSLPDWQLLGYEVLPLPYSPIALIRAAGFAFRFQAERYVAYYLWQVVLPLSVVIVMSWAAFWVVALVNCTPVSSRRDICISTLSLGPP